MELMILTAVALVALHIAVPQSNVLPNAGNVNVAEGKEMSEDLDKKREERRRRARALVEQLKEKGNKRSTILLILLTRCFS